MAIDENAIVVGIAAFNTTHGHLTQRLRAAFLAYEAAKPVPASGGVEAVRLVLEDIKASAHSVGWVKHRAAQALLALASSTPAEAEAGTGEVVRDATSIAERLRASSDPVGEIVLFGEGLKEVSWHKGRMPLPGTKLYALPAEAEAASSPATMEGVSRDRIATIIQNAIAEHCSWDSDEGGFIATGPASYKAADRILSALSPEAKERA